MSLLFPGGVRKVAISGAGVRVCRDFTEISTHYSNTARIFNRRSGGGCRRVHQAQCFQTAYFFLIFRQADKAAVFRVNAYRRIGR